MNIHEISRLLENAKSFEMYLSKSGDLYNYEVEANFGAFKVDVKGFVLYGCWRPRKIFNYKRQNPNTYKQLTLLTEVKT